MEEVTFALAILLVSGYIVSKIGQLIHLPHVTGYILAGLLLGSTGFGIISEETTGERLSHFTSIALMLIAFGIGEHLEIKKLRKIIKGIGIIGIGETSGAFLLTGVACFLVVKATNVGPTIWTDKDFYVLAMLLAAVSVATAPAATLHVMRELKARGDLTTTLMAVVAIDDGLAIMFFGISISMAHHVMGFGSQSLLVAITSGLTEILLSLVIGITAGFIIDLIVKKLKNRSEMLTIGLAILLFSGETARIMNLSPLLVGMAAGFTIVNRDSRDVRIFRVLNTFEPPIYVLFFTMAGTQLHLSALISAGWLGLTYFLARSLGKIVGAYTGARIAGAPEAVRKFLGLALMPQAGVAIGLIFLIKNDSVLSEFSAVVTPVVLAGVVISELTGPICAKFAVVKAGETKLKASYVSKEEPSLYTMDKDLVCTGKCNWNLNQEIKNTKDSVIFGLSNSATAAYLTHIGLIMANHYSARPIALRVFSNESKRDMDSQHILAHGLFERAMDESYLLGGKLSIETICSETVSKGVITCATDHNSKCIIVGHPIDKKIYEYHSIVENTATKAGCPIIVARFNGLFHTNKVLVPVTKMEELNYVQNLLMALSKIASEKITLQYLMPADAHEDKIKLTEEKLKKWISRRNISQMAHILISTSEAMLDSILEESEHHNLIVMAASETQGLQRLFFGSLGEDVAKNRTKPMLIVYNPRLTGTSERS